MPYRNSMMTSVLRDSLGGNCMTTMIATCSMEKRNMDVSMWCTLLSSSVCLYRVLISLFILYVIDFCNIVYFGVYSNINCLSEEYYTKLLNC